MTADGLLSVGRARGVNVDNAFDSVRTMRRRCGSPGRWRERAAAEATMSRHPAELGYDAWRAVFDESGGCGAVVADPEFAAGGTEKC